MFFNGLVIDPGFYDTHFHKVVILEPKLETYPPNLEIGIRILISLVEEVTQSSHYKNFSSFKKAAANFQNNFLGVILGVAIYFTKYIIKIIATDQSLLHQLSRNLLDVLKLFESITNYPYGGGCFSTSPYEAFEF